MLKPFSMTQAVNKSGTDSAPSNLTEEQEDDTKFNSNDKWQIFSSGQNEHLFKQQNR